MLHTLLNPDGLHDPAKFGYSHTASVPSGTQLVFVSGQYGSSADGAVASTAFADQVQRAFSNLSVALTAHGLSLKDVVQLRTYIVGIDFDKLGIVGRAVQEGWGSAPPTQTMLGVAGLALPDMLFEVDAIAARAAR